MRPSTISRRFSGTGSGAPASSAGAGPSARAISSANSGLPLDAWASLTSVGRRYSWPSRDSIRPRTASMPSGPSRSRCRRPGPSARSSPSGSASASGVRTVASTPTAQTVEAPDGERQRPRGRGVEPLHVVDREHQRARLGGAHEQRAEAGADRGGIGRLAGARAPDERDLERVALRRRERRQGSRRRSGRRGRRGRRTTAAPRPARRRSAARGSRAPPRRRAPSARSRSCRSRRRPRRAARADRRRGRRAGCAATASSCSRPMSLGGAAT